MQLLAVDPATGATSAVREDSDPHWVNIVPGVPARTGSGRIVWTVTRAAPGAWSSAPTRSWPAGRAGAVTPAGLQVREILSVDGDTVLFTASATTRSPPLCGPPARTG